MVLQALIWLRPRRLSGSPAQLAWQRLDQRLGKLGLGVRAGEGPRDWQQRLRQALPQQRAAIDGFFDRFIEQSYAPRQPGEAPAQLQPALQTLLRSLPRRRPPAPSQALD
jgi:hypothetical protein